jgi:hypothetical protein
MTGMVTTPHCDLMTPPFFAILPPFLRHCAAHCSRSYA